MEMRESARRSINIPCTLNIHGTTFEARVLDLSAKGVFVEFDDLPECGAEISLNFQIKGRMKVVDLNLKATVLYGGRFLQGFKNFYGFAVSFKNPSPATTAFLDETLQEIETGPKRKYGLS
jgi:hypothetical protein